jgi:hypothetical protein
MLEDSPARMQVVSPLGFRDRHREVLHEASVPLETNVLVVTLQATQLLSVPLQVKVAGL